MIKKLILRGDSDSKKIKLICDVKFGGVSESELAVLHQVLRLALNGGLTVTREISKQMVDETGLSESVISTNLHRLSKKGLFDKSGRVITAISGLFKDIFDTEGYLFIFKAEE